MVPPHEPRTNRQDNGLAHKLARLFGPIIMARPRRRPLVISKPPKRVNDMTNQEIEDWAERIAEGMRAQRETDA